MCGKLRQKGYTLYDSNDLAFWERQNYGDSEKNIFYESFRRNKA
jgi:hypothetical protein